jgi:Carboxypeptidase regulatory-like domain
MWKFDVIAGLLLRPRMLPLLAMVVCFHVAPARQTDGGNRQAAQQNGSISGRVIFRSTGSAVGSALVKLSGFQKAVGPVSASTGADGSFAFKNVPPGRYFISAELDQFKLAGGLFARQVRLAAGDEVKVDLNLAKAASISGRVLTTDGVGVPGVSVGAWVKSFRDGRPTVMFRRRVVTDSAGEYRVDNLRRGTYAIGVIPKPLVLEPGTVLDAGVDTRRVYTRVFYPGVPTIADAAKVPLEDEEQMSNIDLSVRTVKGYCVTASLPDSLQGDSNIGIDLAERTSQTELALGTGVLNSAKHFHFCGVPPGDYALRATIAPSERTTQWFGMQPFTVEKTDIKLDAMPLDEPQKLLGQVMVDKQQLVQRLPTTIRLGLEPVDRLPFADEDVFDPQVDSNGRINIRRLYSGEYWIKVTGLSPGYYVSDVSTGSRDGLQQPIQVGTGELKITVRSDGPSLSGKITTVDNNGPDLKAAVVVLMSSSDLYGTSIQTASTDQNGQFEFLSGISPGAFKLLALSGLGPDDAKDPAVVSRYLSKATEIDLKPSTSQTIELHPIPVS